MRIKKPLMLSSIIMASLLLVACSDDNEDVAKDINKAKQENTSTSKTERVSKKELEELNSSFAASSQSNKPTKKEIEEAVEKINDEKSQKLVKEGISKSEQKEIISQAESALTNLNNYNLEQLSKELDLPITSKSKDTNRIKLSKMLDAYTSDLGIKDLKGSLSSKKLKKDFKGLYQEKPDDSGYIFTVERYGTTATYHFNKDKNGQINNIFITYPALDNKESSDKFIKTNFGLSYTGKSKNLQTYYNLETGEVDSLVFKETPSTDKTRVVIVTNTIPDGMYYTEEVIMRN